jgi:hypothetical protein
MSVVSAKAGHLVLEVILEWIGHFQLQPLLLLGIRVAITVVVDARPARITG